MLRSIPCIVTTYQILRGIQSAVGVGFRLSKRPGGTHVARYCYSVWMRYLFWLEKCGMKDIPRTLVELGPGDSLGIGLCAMLSGVETYYAFDVVEYANSEYNLTILEELIDLFHNREAIPNNGEFPLVYPVIEDYSFPGHILSEELLERTLCKDRLERIRNYLRVPNCMDGSGGIHYVVPWTTYNGNYPKVDLIISQAVLEHVDELEKTYQIMAEILTPSGFMSHQIDFSSHGTAAKWNGHWLYSDNLWKIICGKRAYLINRQPLQTYLDLAAKNGLTISKKILVTRSDGVPYSKNISRFREISVEDFMTKSAFLVMNR